MRKVGLIAISLLCSVSLTSCNMLSFNLVKNNDSAEISTSSVLSAELPDMRL